MATTHSLSVLTNASVKPPRNPETGLSKTLPERFPTYCEDDGYKYTAKFARGDEGDRPKSKVPEEEAIRSVYESAVYPDVTARDLSLLSDDAFYEKLLQLKSEQKKTLQLCERLYREKYGYTIDVPKEQQSFVDTIGKRPSPNASMNGYHEEFMVTGRSDANVTGGRRSPSPVGRRTPSPEMENRWATSPPRISSQKKNFRELSAKPPRSKPPSGRPPVIARAVSPPPIRARPSSAPVRRPHSVTLDEDILQTVIGLRKSWESDRESLPNDTAVSEPGDVRNTSRSRIEDMWEHFSIEDYAPRRQRSSSLSLTGRENKEEKKTEWRHRITIPKPFTMTIREALKEKMKSKTQLQFEKEMEERKKAEEEECQKKFKAQPVPAHVYLPLFDEVMEQQEAKRRYVRQNCEELLKSKQKPFQFVKREEDKKQHLLSSRDCTLQKEQKENIPKKKITEFKAKPVPKYIFDDSVDDKIMEEEEYRKIRVKMRAEELLKTSSVPPSMAARQKAAEEKQREKEMRSKRRSHKRSHVHHEVPDYDALYRQFQKEMMRRKYGKEATVMKPFKLTENKKTSKTKILKDMARDEETLVENRWPYKNPRMKPKNIGALSTSLDSLPSKATHSAELRSSRVKSQMRRMQEKEQRESEEERKRRIQEMRLRKYITERTQDGTPRHRETYEEKLKRIQAADRERHEQYEKELQEMKDRVKNRPLLFEQESQTNAKKAAEKKFNATLRSVGLDEDFVQSRGSRSASVYDDTEDYEEDFEDTYVKRRGDSERSLSPVEA